jgi:hypothetical protein
MRIEAWRGMIGRNLRFLSVLVGADEVREGLQW